MGSEIYSKACQPGNIELIRETVQLKDWQAGVYFIRLKDSQNIIAVKSFIVM